MDHAAITRLRLLGQGDATTPPSRAGLVLLALFALPFAVVGAGVLARSLGLWAEQGANEESVVSSAMGVLFLGVGVGLWSLLPRMRGRQLADWERRAQNPEQPWLWREEWASGRIAGDGMAMLAFVWGFAIFASLVASPMLFVVPRELSRGNQAALLGALFPLVGLGLLIWAVRVTLRWRRFGRSHLELQTLPGVIGGRLVGTVQIGSDARPERGFEARLQCVELRQSGSGKNRSTHEITLWEEKRQVGAGEVHAGRLGTAVPIRFTIPHRLEETTMQPGRRSILWRLALCAELPGVDYATNFEVPVFRTPESDPEVTDADAAADTGTAEQAPARPVSAAGGGAFRDDSRIRATRDHDGRTIFRFPPARNVGTALGISFMAALWGGIIVVLSRLDDVPLPIVLGFGFFEVLLLWGALRYWFRSTRVDVRPADLEIRTRTLLVGRRRVLPADTIRTILVELNGLNNGRPFYDIHVQTHVDGRTRAHTAGDMMRDKREAEWLAREMWRALGREGPLPPRSE